MKITIENIGVLKYVEYELGQMTIVCGKNNTGKTYATYALFGFFDFFRRGYNLKISNESIDTLLHTGSLSIQITSLLNKAKSYVSDACRQYHRVLPRIFAARSKNFENSRFSVSLANNDLNVSSMINEVYTLGGNDILQLSKEENGEELLISLILNKNYLDRVEELRAPVYRVISRAIKKILFDDIFKECFLSSAERTGAVIFKDELNFERNSILRQVASSDEITLGDIVDKIYNTNYPLPVRRNIDFIRNLESISKEEGELFKAHPSIIEDFNKIVGGEYRVSNKDGIYYCPSKSKTKRLTINESASSVRSMLDLYFYLKYMAKPGQMLMIDEPELNLHPSGQRGFARLLTRLVKYGIQIYITTHSDYIVKEINTLLMFNNKKENSKVKSIMAQYGYEEEDLIAPEQLKVYVSKIANIQLPGNQRKSRNQTFQRAIINPIYGIESTNFDSTIEEMNNIQESIIFL